MTWHRESDPALAKTALEAVSKRGDLIDPSGRGRFIWRFLPYSPCSIYSNDCSGSPLNAIIYAGDDELFSEGPAGIHGFGRIAVGNRSLLVPVGTDFTPVRMHAGGHMTVDDLLFAEESGELSHRLPLAYPPGLEKALRSGREQKLSGILVILPSMDIGPLSKWLYVTNSLPVKLVKAGIG